MGTGGGKGRGRVKGGKNAKNKEAEGRRGKACENKSNGEKPPKKKKKTGEPKNNDGADDGGRTASRSWGRKATKVWRASGIYLALKARMAANRLIAFSLQICSARRF